MARKATTPAPVAVQTLSQLDILVREYLELDAQRSALAKSLTKLKEEITGYADARFAEFDGDELTLETGKVKVVLNPPKMVFDQNDKTVSPSERAHLAAIIPVQYITTDVNVKLIQDRLNADKILAQGLKGLGIRVQQDTRYDIKPLKG